MQISSKKSAKIFADFFVFSCLVHVFCLCKQIAILLQ